MSSYGNRCCFVSPLALIVVLVMMLANCAPNPRVYKSDNLSLLYEASIALIPLDNLTDDEDAARQVYDIFLVEMLKLGKFSIVDPGEVERVLAEERIRFTAELSKDQIQKVGKELGASILLQGVLLEYGIRQVQGFNVVDVPYVSVMMKMVDAGSGKILWASSYSRNGNDTEKVFGFGRITSLSRLAEVMATELLKSLDDAFRHRMEI